MNDVVDRLEMLLRGEILLSEPEKRVLYREAAAEIEKLHAEVWPCSLETRGGSQ